MNLKWKGRVALFAFASVLAACSGDAAAPAGASSLGGSAGTSNAAGAAGSTGGSGVAGTAGVAGAAGASTRDAAFVAWDEARAAFRKSPDHLPERARAVVATKDAAAIFAFVRDNIATYPPSDEGFARAVTAQRWGQKGTLRGGAGTPREKAELLRDLYVQAGFEAVVVQGLADPAKLDGKRVLLRTMKRTHAPPATPAQQAAWLAALGQEGAAPLPVSDADGTKRTALAASLAALLPTDLSSSFDFTLGEIPLVRVRVAGVDTYANPLAITEAFGEPLTVGALPLSVAATADAPYTIRVKLEAARSDAPNKPFELLARTYGAADVVGRRVQISFPPPKAPSALAKMRVADIETYVPVLSVVGPDVSTEEKASLAAVAGMISRGGTHYTQDTKGTLSVDGVVTPAPDASPAQIASVAKLTATARASTFPRVLLRVSAFDEAGAKVSRLGPTAFAVSEDGQPKSFSMSRLAATPPRLILLFDTSASLPLAFMGQGAVTMGEQIVDELYALYPQAEVRFAKINPGDKFVSTTWAKDVVAAKAQAKALTKTASGSTIWEAVAAMQAEKPTAIVLVSDGQASDKPEPAYLAAIAGGAPIVSLGIGNVKAATFDALTTLSGGRYLSVTQRSEAVAAAVDFLKTSPPEDYALSYQADLTGPAVRKVAIEVNGKLAEASYEVPAAPTVAPALSGLYLTITVGDRERRMTLAGLDLGSGTIGVGGVPPVVTEAMLADVRAMLLGRVSLGIEGGAPSPSVVYDDWLTDKLSLEPLLTALKAEDQPAIDAALDQGLTLSPAGLPFAFPDLGALALAPNATELPDTLTFETAPRIVGVVQTLAANGPVTKRLDVFPLSSWRTAAVDPAKAYRTTLERTASLAIYEADALAGTSTYEALAGQPLTLVDAGKAQTQPGLTPEERLRWKLLESAFVGRYKLLVPAKPGPFWAIDTQTGTTIGLLPDGTGGAAERACEAYAATNAYIQGMGLLGGLFGISLGGWAALGQWENENVTMAILVILGVGSAGPLSNPALAMGCGMAGDAIGNAIPAYSAYDAVASTLGTIGASSSFPTLCPSGSPCD